MAAATRAFGAPGKETRVKRGVQINVELGEQAASGMYGYGKQWLM